MANNDSVTPGLSESSTGGNGQAVGSEKGSSEVFTEGSVAAVSTGEKTEVPNSSATTTFSAESDSNSRPTIVTTVPGSSAAGVSAPHPKKFSAVNINKKFLQKNSSSPISASPTLTNSPLKSGSPAPARPIAQATSSHSRLVTTKLTASLQASTTTGPGWSRPSSVNPSATPSPSPANANPNTSTTAAPAPAAPQLPHAGKVIQPQRAGSSAIAGGSGLSKDSSGKPVWGNVRSGVSPPDTRVHSDFPTAAEVASVAVSQRRAKLSDAKEAAENAAADKQARSVEADTFRGVHLDPNAHHWDEMEEDDDNFLDGVIEFGDGRQYKVEPTDGQVLPGPGSKDEEGLDAAPVSKEERFADDFDRSWPRSRNSPSTLPREPPPHAHHAVPLSPSSSQATQSPQDASRVLFNERSNRLEPYSRDNAVRAGPAPGPHPPHRRGSHAESVLPPGDLRGGRDLPPHSQGQGVQLLQKSGEGTTRQGPFGPIASGASTISKTRGRDPHRQTLPLNIPPGQEPGRPRDHHAPAIVSPGSRDSGDARGRRLSNMGPPPLPASIRDRSKDLGRQLPPHLAQTSPPQHRVPSVEAHPRPPSTAPTDSTSSRRPSFANPPAQSPVLSHMSVTSDTPSQVAAVSPIDVENAHKAAMHLSAERARQRRQQEEEERQRAQERARLKAAELEAKFKTAESPKEPKVEGKPSESDVTNFLEDAIKDSAPTKSQALTSPKSPLHRTPSLRAAGRPPNNLPRPLRPPVSAQIAGPPLISPASEVNSWRNKAKVAPPPPHVQVLPPVPTPAAPPKPPPTMLHGEEILAVHPDDDLEEVDFSDMGKFAGLPDAPREEDVRTAEGLPTKPHRPVAADFFGETSALGEQMSKSDTGPWRRKQHQDEPSISSNSGSASQTTTGVKPELHEEVEVLKLEPSTETSSTSPGKAKFVVPDPQSAMNGLPRAPRGPVYREATMSALDDVMSRIKGALDGMQTTDQTKGPVNSSSAEGISLPTQMQLPPSKPAPSSVPPTTKPLSKPSKWMPPALRARDADFGQQPEEVFDVTIPELPRSPEPAWKAFAIRLPKHSRPMKPLTKQQSQLYQKIAGPARWDILSFDPPVPGMQRREFSVVDVLFPKPHLSKGKRRYTISIPNSRVIPESKSDAEAPKVHLPPSPVAARAVGGAFGRPSGATERSSWRKSAAAQTTMAESLASDSGFNPISRSPPPELASNPAQAIATRVDDLIPNRSKLEPKMPVGSAVAFYRSSRVDSLESAPTSSVNFTVSSELEAGRKSLPLVPPSPSVNPGAIGSARPSNSNDKSVRDELRSQPTSPEFVPTLIQSKAGSKSSEDSIDRVPITPPSQASNGTWTKPPINFAVKESPARAPDPEHLKAVWSQPSNKTRVHSINSLEGIADDLTALPFTLQDVKSEDGGTPPPTTSAPSRMSLHDVTKAFQQVPSSSSSSSAQHPAPLSPSKAAGPVARPPGYSYNPLPPPAANIRPSYASYPSPMMNHSPSPTLVYSHAMSPSPVPRMQQNGHSPFNQPLWMPVPGPQSQTPGNMMRPVPSPYPGQMVAYPTPGGPSMYAAHPQPHPQNPAQHLGSAPGRGRGMPMSPGMQHAPATMYPGSPVLMHTPVMHPHHNPYMSPVPNGRGQLRPDHPGQHVAPSSGLPASSHHPGYAPVTQTSFVRPNW